MWVFFSFLSLHNVEKWERQVEIKETRESKAKRRQFWKRPSDSDGGDSVVRDVKLRSLFTETRPQMGSSLECPG